MHIKNEADHANPCHAALGGWGGGREHCHTINDCHTQRSVRYPERCNTHTIPVRSVTKNNPFRGVFVLLKQRGEHCSSPSAVPVLNPAVPGQVRPQGLVPQPGSARLGPPAAAATQQRPRAAGSACG